MANRLFESATFHSTASRKRYSREELLSPDIAQSLNTYKNFGVFATYDENYSEEWDPNKPYDPKDDTNIKLNVGKLGSPGVRSIFNKYSAIATGAKPGQVNKSGVYTQQDWEKLVRKTSDLRAGNTPLLDTPENRLLMKKMSGCTVKELIQASKNGWLSGAGYDYSDFMYCKHLDSGVTNNYLITLRRYPVPVLDAMLPTGKGKSRGKRAAGHVPGALPTGQMVTWLGVSGNDMKSIMKYSYKMAFKEMNAKWEDVSKEGGDDGLLNGLEALTNSATRAQFKSGVNVPAMGFFNNFLGMKTGNGPYSPKPFIDSNKVYGPIDRVKKIYTRSEEGLDWDQTFTLVFEYEIKSYNGINQRQAMMDLLANILAVTYTQGSFWGGGYRGDGTQQSSTWKNLNIFKCHGTFTDYLNAFSKDLKNGVTQVFGGGNINSLQDFAKAAMKVLNEIGGMLMGGLINSLGRPAKFKANSLLSDTPVGLWHVTIGNPMRPIMSMGNMILKNTTIEHSGPLGIDDFPTFLKVTCELQRGRPRDSELTEKMYNGGQARIFHTMDAKLYDMYKSAAKYRETIVKESEIKPVEADKPTESPAATPEASDAVNTSGAQPVSLAGVAKIQTGDNGGIMLLANSDKSADEKAAEDIKNAANEAAKAGESQPKTSNAEAIKNLDTKENREAYAKAAKESQDRMAEKISKDTGMSVAELEGLNDFMQSYFFDPDYQAILMSSMDLKDGFFPKDPPEESPKEAPKEGSEETAKDQEGEKK